MYLYIEFFDSWGAYQDLQFGTSSTTSRKRIKKIKLTEDQIKEIKPLCTGNNRGEQKFETMNVLSIQKD